VTSGLPSVSSDVAGPPAASFTPSLTAGDWLRIVLVPVFVGATYLSQWTALLAFECGILVRLLRLSGFSVVSTEATVFHTSGLTYRFVMACAVLQSLLAVIPLLWNGRKSWLRNLAEHGVFCLVASAINLVRLWLGFVLLRMGVPWVWGHHGLEGAFYFAMLLWVIREWKRRKASHPSTPTPTRLARPPA